MKIQKPNIFLLKVTDRGFRDSILLLERKGYALHKPESLLQGEESLLQGKEDQNLGQDFCFFMGSSLYFDSSPPPFFTSRPVDLQLTLTVVSSCPAAIMRFCVD